MDFSMSKFWGNSRRIGLTTSKFAEKFSGSDIYEGIKKPQRNGFESLEGQGSLLKENWERDEASNLLGQNLTIYL